MKDNLFDTQQKRSSAISDFSSLMKNPGWLLLQEVVNLNIKVLSDQLENGSDDQTLDDIKNIRNKIKIHRRIIETPEFLIKKFESPQSEEVEFDPYE